jgi:protocatechuate 3,4-dioxygenase beta subunit
MSDTCQLQHIKLHHPENLHVELQKNRTIRSDSQCVDPAQSWKFNTNQDCGADFDLVVYLAQVENIAEAVVQPPAPPLLQMKTHLGNCAPLSRYLADRWQCDTQGFLETNMQHNPYYLFAKRKELQSIQ